MVTCPLPSSLPSNDQLYFLLLCSMLVPKSVSDESQPLSRFCDLCSWNKVFRDKAHLESLSLFPSSSVNTHSSTAGSLLIFSFQFNSTRTYWVPAIKFKVTLQCVVKSAKLCEIGSLLYSAWACLGCSRPPDPSLPNIYGTESLDQWIPEWSAQNNPLGCRRSILELVCTFL